MSDAPGTAANADVSIQNVSPDVMQVSVNGEIKEIKNTLDDLKALLQKTGTEQFQSGKNIYNIGSITNATFSADIGKKTFNMYLCRKLTESISVYNDVVKRNLGIWEADKPDWETSDRWFKKGSNYIISGFTGVVGMLLRRVFASGADAFVSNSSRDYVAVCIATATRTLQLLCFSFMSKLWDYKKNNSFSYNADELKILNRFFNAGAELYINEYLKLLQALVNIFDAQNITYPFTEFNKDCVADGSSFNNACKELEKIKSKLDAGPVYSTAFEAENELTGFLSVLSFLVNYKMVSVKDITYNNSRNEEVQYLHSYTFLGVGNDNNFFSSKFKYDVSPVSNDAVLIYKDKYQEGINLFPFIIDINALTNEMEVKICSYTYFEEDDTRLTYVDIDKIASDKNTNDKSIGDASQTMIQFNDDVEEDLAKPDHDVTDLFSDAKKFKTLQLNAVYKIFQNARKGILE